MTEFHNTSSPQYISSIQSSSGAKLESLLDTHEELKIKKGSNIGRNFTVNLALVKNTFLIANTLKNVIKEVDKETAKEIKAKLFSQSPIKLVQTARDVVKLLKQKEILNNLEPKKNLEPKQEIFLGHHRTDEGQQKIREQEANKTAWIGNSKEIAVYNKSQIDALKIVSARQLMKNVYNTFNGEDYHKQLDREFGDSRRIPFIDANGKDHEIALETVSLEKRNEARNKMYRGKNAQDVNVFPPGTKFTPMQQKQILALILGDESLPFFPLGEKFIQDMTDKMNKDLSEGMKKNYVLGSMHHTDFNSLLSSISEDENGNLKLHKQERYPVKDLETGKTVGYIVISRSYDINNPNKLPEASVKFYEGSEHPPKLSTPGLSPSNSPASPPKNSIKV